MVGSETESLASSLGGYHELDSTMCSSLGTPDMCSMVSIDHFA